MFKLHLIYTLFFVYTICRIISLHNVTFSSFHHSHPHLVVKYFFSVSMPWTPIWSPHFFISYYLINLVMSEDFSLNKLVFLCANTSLYFSVNTIKRFKLSYKNLDNHSSLTTLYLFPFHCQFSI